MKDLTIGEHPPFDFKKLNPEIINSHVRETKEMMLMYDCGIKEVKTKLEILNNEFQIQKERNPIEYLKSRVKSLESIVMKLHKKGYALSVENAMKHLHDIAGIRVICSFIDDIYMLKESLERQDDITILEEKDYIKNPKKNGYRSLHLIVEIPIFLLNEKKMMKVEVQLRTIAMEFWANLEHKLRYKKNLDASLLSKVGKDLSTCADVSAKLDLKMQNIRDMIESIENK